MDKRRYLPLFRAVLILAAVFLTACAAVEKPSAEPKPSAAQEPSSAELKPSAAQEPSSAEPKPSAAQEPSFAEPKPDAAQESHSEGVFGELSSKMLCCGLPSAFNLSLVPPHGREAWADVNDDVPFFSEKEIADAGRMAAAAGDGSDSGDESLPRGYQVYGPLDSLGRCTGAIALVGTETLPREERGNISSVKPTGWHTAEYDNIDGRYLYNRCHLIGYQLTGQNINEQNLITGTRYMNVEGMLPYEESVLAYVKGTGNHVLYRVSPVFEGKNLVAEGVLMEAQSIEDPLVRFCAFCFNVQPGIEIDYASGESRTIEALPERTLSGSASDADGDVGDGGGSASDADGGAEEQWDYIVNVSSRIFHRPDCESVGKMREKNRQGFSGARDDLIRAGYRPCKNCNP